MNSINFSGSEFAIFIGISIVILMLTYIIGKNSKNNNCHEYKRKKSPERIEVERD